VRRWSSDERARIVSAALNERQPLDVIETRPLSKKAMGVRSTFKVAKHRDSIDADLPLEPGQMSSVEKTAIAIAFEQPFITRQRSEQHGRRHGMILSNVACISAECRGPTGAPRAIICTPLLSIYRKSFISKEEPMAPRRAALPIERRRQPAASAHVAEHAIEP